MSFASMMTDTVELLKRDGTSVKGIKASVQKASITTFDASIVIEPHDLLIRTASNGVQETYEVIDPVFHEKFHGIPANYQIQVKNSVCLKRKERYRASRSTSLEPALG